MSHRKGSSVLAVGVPGLLVFTLHEMPYHWFPFKAGFLVGLGVKSLERTR